MARQAALGILMLCLCFSTFASNAVSEMYQWVDDQGGIHFSDQSGSVPTKYQKNVTVRESMTRETPKQQPEQDNSGSYVEETINYSNKKEANQILNQIINQKGTTMKGGLGRGDGTGYYEVRRYIKK